MITAPVNTLIELCESGVAIEYARIEHMCQNIKRNETQQYQMKIANNYSPVPIH
jgi:hypothetical protein